MKKIKVKLNRSEIEAMHNMLMMTITFFDAVGTKNMLIKENMYEVLNQLDKMRHNDEQKKFTLKLSGAQSIALIAFTNFLPLARSPYEAVLFNRIAETIHKTHANAYAKF